MGAREVWDFEVIGSSPVTPMQKGSQWLKRVPFRATFFAQSMDKAQLETYLQQGLSTREIARASGKSQTSVRYWLRKHKLPIDYVRISGYLCRHCGETDPAKFYDYRKRVCGKCDNIRVKKKAMKNRRLSIDYLGGKCAACGYNTYECALDIHHLDLTQKDPNFASSRYWSWECIVLELNGCVLLCKNCHAAVHNGDLTL